MFTPAFVAATLLLVFGVATFAIWSRYSRTTPAPQPVIATGPQNPATGAESPVVPTNETQAPQPEKAVIASQRNKATNKRHAMLLAANRKLEKDAKSIANW